MRKLVAVGLSLALLVGIYSPSASAEYLNTTEQQLKAIEEEIEEVTKQIKETPDEERGPGINEKIQLVMKKNKLEAIIKAYELSLHQDSKTSAEVLGTSTSAATGEIPAQYMPIYQEAGKKYGVDWSILASIHKIETDFSRISNMVSSAGAVGHMQFMPETFEAYGVDGNKNGKISAYEVEDAIYSAANYLADSGYKKDIRKALWAYNHAEWYIDEVLSVAATYKAGTNGNSTVSLASALQSTFIKPTYGRFTSKFGWRDIGAGQEFHKGVDLANVSGTDVVASAAGTVTHSQNMGGYGNVVILKHTLNGKEYATVYAHLSALGVSVGQQVTQGQSVGKMGNTGRSFGSHLHFEIHIGEWNGSRSNAVDPAPYINL